METGKITPSPQAAVPRLDMDGLAFILFGHAAFQHLNAACELGLFEFLAGSPAASRAEIGAALGVQERPADILLLGCTSLGLLVKSKAGYSVAPVITALMDGGDWQRFKDTVAFEQHVVYEGQADLTESPRRNANVGLRRVGGTGRDLYHRLSENPRWSRSSTATCGRGPSSPTGTW